MRCGLGAVVLLMVQACGGRGRDAEGEPAGNAEQEPKEPSTADTGTAGASSGATFYTGSEAARVCLGFEGGDPNLVPPLCRICIPGTVPRCLDRPVPERETEPQACAEPDCEVAEISSSSGLLAIGAVFRGSCGDGKSFEGAMGPLYGMIYYSRSGQGLVGTSSYSPSIGKCECSGEAFNGDVRCPSPTFETEPAGELRLPFADGQPSAPCMCAD